MTDQDKGARRRSGRDTLSLVAAAVLLVIAVAGIGGAHWWLVPHLMPWLAAGVAALIGVGLIVGSLPRRSR